MQPPVCAARGTYNLPPVTASDDGRPGWLRGGLAVLLWLAAAGCAATGIDHYSEYQLPSWSCLAVFFHHPGLADLGRVVTLSRLLSRLPATWWRFVCGDAYDSRRADFCLRGDTRPPYWCQHLSDYLTASCCCVGGHIVAFAGWFIHALA